MYSDHKEIKKKLIELNNEHRKIDHEISQLINAGHKDELYISRLKRKKLKIKDRITYLKNSLIPDLDA